MGCSSTPEEPSILVVAVESLNFNDFNCDLSELSGFKPLCEDSMVYTHAYTTSSLSAPAIGSLLTGLYPVENNLRTNTDYLSENVQTSSEVALSKKYRTSFFSGGSPILSRSGLNQGFEIFDMPSPKSKTDLYQSSSRSFNLFSNWLDKLKSNEKFFTMIYIPDLMYPSVSTSNEEGEERARSFSSQLQELGESFGLLVRELKSQKRWHNTHIFFVGLNGRLIRSNQIKPLSLESENIRVGFRFKPAHKKRDKGMKWKLDYNVSLADIGKTIFGLLGSEIEVKHNLFPRLALYPEQSELQNERSILVESSWLKWHRDGPTFKAIIKGNDLLTYESEFKFYNILLDQRALHPYSSESREGRRMRASFEDEMKFINPKKNAVIDSNFIQEVKIANKFLNESKEEQSLARQMLNHLIEVKSVSLDSLNNWQARLAFRDRDWVWLKEISVASKNLFWETFSKIQLEEEVKLERQACASMLIAQKANKSLMNKCDNILLVRLFNYHFEKNKELKSKKLHLFKSMYKYRIMQSKINRVNQLKMRIFSNKITYDQDLLDVQMYLYINKRLKRQIVL